MNQYPSSNTRRLVVKRVFISLALMTFSVTASAQQPRIISTDAGSTDILIALGIEKELVGIDVTSEVPATFNVAKLGYHRMLSTEGIFSLNPDMIIGSEHMGPPEAVEAIKKSKLSLLQLPTARNEQTLKDNIEKISSSIDKKAQAEPLLDRIEQTMSVINKQQLPPNTSVAFLLQMDGRSLSLAGSNTTGNDIITLLGGDNLGQHHGYHTVSAESLLSLEPDIIIVANQDMSQPPVETLLRHHSLLQHTPAGQQQKIIGVDGRVLVAGISLASIDALANMAMQLQQASPSSAASL